MPPRLALIAASVAGLASALAAGCYRPRQIDCVLACSASHACPNGMACEAGLCTSGATCVTDVAAGARHSCVVRAGAVICFGNNDYGQLGTRDPQVPGGDHSAPPTPVDLGGQVATVVVTGGRHTCAIASAGGTTAGVICWGDNALGQLGLARGGTRGTRPTDSFDWVPLAANRAGAPLATDRAVSALAAGLAHTCARLDDASVVCWGDDRFGQLGVAPPTTSTFPFAPVALGGPAAAVSAGAYHSCALMADGGVRCWGWNDLAQLGDNKQPGGERAPGLIVAVPLPAAATAVAAGAFHTCARLDTGAVTCWGLNDAGQVGTMRATHPTYEGPGKIVPLGAKRTALTIAAGTAHSCALLDDFSVKCWGFNLDGELGIGDDQNHGDDEPLGDDLPRVALGSAPISRLAVGAHHACVVQTAGVKCWGLGSAGQLGAGDLNDRGDKANPTIVFATLAAPP